MFKIQPHYLLSELLAWHTAFRCVLDSLSDDLLPRKAMIVASTLPGSSTLALFMSAEIAAVWLGGSKTRPSPPSMTWATTSSKPRGSVAL
eukprot:scaffold274561_cov31-Tisochrysis_lutea.AAC.2